MSEYYKVLYEMKLYNLRKLEKEGYYELYPECYLCDALNVLEYLEKNVPDIFEM